MPWMVHYLNSFSFKKVLIMLCYVFSVDFKLRVDFSGLTIRAQLGTKLFLLLSTLSFLLLTHLCLSSLDMDIRTCLMVGMGPGCS